MRLRLGVRGGLLSTVLGGAALAALAGPAAAAQLLTRTLQERPAIVLTAFGTSTRAQVTYDVLEARVRERFPEHELRWAFTSEVIRERVNRRRAAQGRADRLGSLQEALADLEARGYRKVVVQPLHVFPGEEYEEVLAIVEHFPGLRIETGEALLHRWEVMYEVVRELARDFLPPEEGCNVVVAHGTPRTDVGSNLAYLGLDRHLSRRYRNAFLGAVDGVVTREDALEAAKAYPVKRVRFVPLMYVAGDHIMNDVMGEEEGPEPSWRAELAAAGVPSETLTVSHGGDTYYKGLGFLPAVNEVFVREIERALERL